MKRILLFLLTAHCSLLTLFSQAPQGLNYQAIVRDDAGNTVSDHVIGIRISILKGSISGTVVYSETHGPATNSFGLVTLAIGSGTTSDDFSAIDWGGDIYFLKVEMDASGGTSYSEMGTTQLLSVPYALFAENATDKDDADANPENEIQDLALSDNVLRITENPSAKNIDLSVYLDNTDSWVQNGDAIFFNGNIGIGTNTPGGKLEVVGDGTEASDDPLFEVKRSDGQTVFAVYPEGVRIYVEESESKGTKGGFAIGGFNPATKALTNEFLRVTPDSVRVYVNDDGTKGTKGTKGGFAVGGFSPAVKGITGEYLRVSPDSVRVYINDETVKGTKGGFAIGGYSPSKGMTREFLRVTDDSTRVYVDNEVAKGTKGGFAVGGYSPAVKGQAIDFMQMTKDNYFIGHESGKATTTGLYNSFLGFETGLDNTSGSNNALFGFQAGYHNNAGSSNLFLGYQSGFSNTDGNYNSFMGYKAGHQNTTGNMNSFLGSYSGVSNTSGSNNTFSGFNAGYSNINGNANNFFGTNSGFTNTSGSNNIFIGPESGFLNDAGSYNTFIGYRAGYSNLVDFNVFAGFESGYNNTTGEKDVFIGYQAGRENTEGSNNVLIGNQAGRGNVYGYSNVYLGDQAGYSNTSGIYNVYIGHLAGYNGNGDNSNVFIGYKSGYSTTISNSNVFIGEMTGRLTTWGSSNVYIGDQAGEMNATGSENVCIGVAAGQKSSAGANVLIGFAAGWDNTSGASNVFIGNQAGWSNTTGGNNIFIGSQTGYTNSAGSGNIFIGRQTGWNETGSNRLYIDNSNTTTPLIWGDFSTDDLRIYGNLHVYDTYFRIANNPGTGTTPTYYAYQGSTGSTSKSGAFAIRDALWVDSYAYFDSRSYFNGILTSQNYININVSGNPSLYIAGDEALWYNGTYFSWGYGGVYNAFYDKVSIGTTGTSGYMLYVNGSAYTTGSWYGSDARLKDDFREIEQPLEKVLGMQGVNYQWRTEDYPDRNFPEGRHYGVIAQDIEKVLPEIVTETNGEKAVAYTEIIPVLIEAMKEQQKLIDVQQSEINELKQMVKELVEKSE